ncbi:MAG: P-loop NTPase [Acutalibacteraceae bacterium]|jgi:septum site-determining protein MinD
MAKKIVIASGKGGVGKSTVTAGLSTALSALGKKVLAIDCDIGLKSLDLMLGVREKVVFNWGDLILYRCKPEQAIVQTEFGPVLLAAPMNYNIMYTRENFRELLKTFNEHFDYILTDSPAGISGGFRLAAGTADSGIIVATPDEVCVRGSAVATDEMIDLGITEPRLIINRFIKKSVVKDKLLNIDEVIDAVGAQLIGVVPEDEEIASCATKGLPFPADTAAALAFNRIALRLEGENQPLKL